MAIFADLIEEWGKLNTPAKVAVGGVGVAAVLFLVSQRGKTGNTTGNTQGNVLGAAAASSPFTSVIATVKPTAPGTSTGAAKPPAKVPTITIPPVHKIIINAVKTKPTAPPLRIVADALLHPIEKITPTAPTGASHGSGQGRQFAM